jgi:protein SCO1/2
VDLSTSFTDEAGKTITLKKYFDGRQPVALILNYYGCPMLCGVMLNQAKDAFAALDWQMGDRYQVITISIDPTETSSLAAAKKASILKSVTNPTFQAAAEKNWHFLVGTKANIDKVANAIGFAYKFLPEEKQYAHGAAIFMLSPTGKLDRVLPALSLSSTDMKLALLEAGEGKIGTLAEKFFALCYHYDPKESKYTILAVDLMKVGGGIMVAVTAIAYLALYMRKKKGSKV